MRILVVENVADLARAVKQALEEDHFAVAGVIGPVPGIIGCFQAGEAVKLLVGCGEPLAGRILEVDLLAGSVRAIGVRPRPGCPACSAAPPR